MLNSTNEELCGILRATLDCDRRSSHHSRNKGAVRQHRRPEIPLVSLPIGFYAQTTPNNVTQQTVSALSCRVGHSFVDKKLS